MTRLEQIKQDKAMGSKALGSELKNKVYQGPRLSLDI
jgi:hypothetical protein